MTSSEKSARCLLRAVAAVKPYPATQVVAAIKRNFGSLLHLILNKFLVIVCSTTFYYDQYFPNTFDYTISYEFTTHSLEAVLYAVRKLHVGQEVFTRR